jgi:hypothetical protein
MHPDKFMNQYLQFLDWLSQTYPDTYRAHKTKFEMANIFHGIQVNPATVDDSIKENLEKIKKEFLALR